MHATHDDDPRNARREAVRGEARDREARVDGAIAAAQDGPRAREPLSGDWAGFTRGRALAWCWRLVQYESGDVLGHWRSPDPRLRREALQAGEIPDGEAFPRRARALERAGLTPETYQEHRRALGATPGLIDVR